MNFAAKNLCVAFRQVFEYFKYKLRGNFDWILWPFRTSLHRAHRWKRVVTLQNHSRSLTKCHFGGPWRFEFSFGTCQRTYIYGLSVRSLCLDCSSTSRSSGGFWLLKAGIWPLHPSYTLTPCDIFLFSRMSYLRQRRFDDVPDIQDQPLTLLHPIPRSQFQRCFQQWQQRWTRCINSEGNNKDR